MTSKSIGELLEGESFLIGGTLHTVYAIVIATGERCTIDGNKKRHIWYDSDFMVIAR